MVLMTFAQARENFIAAMQTLHSSKVRSALTVLGIVIGVSSVISMAAIIQGLNSFIQDRVESLGSRTYVLGDTNRIIRADHSVEKVIVRGAEPEYVTACPLFNGERGRFINDL